MRDDDTRRAWLVVVPLALYLALSIAALLVWDADGRQAITGDEPHYLVVASAIAHDRTFENTDAYAREFRTREIFPIGLAPPDATPTPANTHALSGPRGLYNVHNIGLPLLLAVPFAAGGVLAAKLAMVALNTAVVGACWSATGVFTRRSGVRAWATTVAAVAAPFVFAAGQVYPDVLAGALVLYAVGRFAALDRDTSPRRMLLVGVSLACIPWLQIKFAAVAVLVGAALAVRGYRRTPAPAAVATVAAVAVPLATSGALLGFYNWYAFGRITGPYGDGALEPGGRAAMVLAGLHVDVNQGWVWQAPVWLIGVAALGALLVRRQATAALVVAAYAVLIVPNALHPNWYGGDSVSGRFFWSAAAVLLLPTVAGLVALFARYRAAAIAATAVAAVALVGQYATAVFGDAVLVRRSVQTMARYYPIHWGPVGDVLPKLYAVDWAWTQPVTWAALTIIPAAAWAGASGPRGERAWALRLGPLGAAFALVLVLGTALRAPDRSTFELARLRHQAGEPVGEHWVVGAGTAGFAVYGANVTLGAGSYEARLVYRSDGSREIRVGTAEVVRWPAGNVVTAVGVPGTGGEWADQRVAFTVVDGMDLHELRLHANGVESVELAELTVRRRS